jgi:hypothetical protein
MPSDELHMYIGIPHHTLEPQAQGLLAGRFFFPPFNWQMGLPSPVHFQHLPGSAIFPLSFPQSGV